MNRKFINAFFAAALLLGGATVFSSCKDTNEDMNTQLEADINRNKAEISDLQAKVDALKSCDCSEIQVDLSEIEKRLDGLDSATDELIDALNQEITALEERAAVTVTSLLIQAVENPVFGSISLPLDVKSNMLLTYYGAFDAEFPNVGTSNNVGAELKKSEVTVEDISGEVTAITTDADGNVVENYLGTVYTTINPTSVDASKVELTLVDSQDNNVGGIELQNTAASEKTLYFGLGSRADNGFFESTAVASDLDEIKVDLSGLGEAVREAIADPSKADAKALLELVIEKIRANKFPALGVKAAYSWTEVSNFTIEQDPTTLVWDVTSDVTTEEKSAATYSEYAIAAAAYKPLSFEFLQGATDKLSVLPTIPDLGNFDITNYFNIEIKAGVVEPITATVTISEDAIKVEIPEATIVDNDGNEIGHVEAGQYANVDLTGLQKDIQDAMTKAMENANESIQKAIDDMVNDLNSQLQSAFQQINDKVNAAADKVQPWIDRANTLINKINALLEDPNAYLQVCALYENGEEIHRLSGSSAVPSTFSSDVTSLGAILTTHTLETIVPAYKKYYAVYNLADNSVVDAKVIPGTESRVTISGLKSGNKYQLVYQALDYHGKTSTQNFYFQVAE